MVAVETLTCIAYGAGKLENTKSVGALSGDVGSCLWTCLLARPNSCSQDRPKVCTQSQYHTLALSRFNQNPSTEKITPPLS